MQIPTPDEIKAANEAILRDGPMSEATMALAMMVIGSPILREYISRMARGGPQISMLMQEEPAIAKMAGDSAAAAMIFGALIAGFNYALRIAETRRPRTHTPDELAHVDLHAWIGEDEEGSGKLGLKQGNTAAGLIPLVGIGRDNIEKLYPQMEAQAKRYGKRIRLCLFRFMAVLRETEHGS